MESKPRSKYVDDTAGAVPTAFISYAHGADAWNATVLQFAISLRTIGGIDADLPVWHLIGGQDWATYGPAAIRTSDFILLAVSPAFREAWQGTNPPDRNAGVAGEAAVIKAIFESDQRDFGRRLRVVLLPGAPRESVPPDLFGTVERHEIRSFDSNGLEPLLRSLHGKPLHAKPSLGPLPALPPRTIAELSGDRSEGCPARHERRATGNAVGRINRGLSSERWREGSATVEIQHMLSSTIQVTYGGVASPVALEPALVPVATHISSPAQLLRARSGIVPYAARHDLLTELAAWARGPDPFAVCVIAGHGGSGKTRLAVELCEHAKQASWLSGMLPSSADRHALETLVAVPTSRLIVVDYAETRAEQLELILPLLAAHSTPDHPVRVLLLVRAAPRHGADWTAVLRNRSAVMDTLLGDVDVHVLDNLPLDLAERHELFRLAVRALSTHTLKVEHVQIPDGLTQALFASPLLVVIAAYLALHSKGELPTTRAHLLDELLAHERRYWATTSETAGLRTHLVLNQRVVALATLAGAASESEALELMRLMPELADASAKYRARLARWVQNLYPVGTGFWNPLEPAILAEHLVAAALSDQPALLAGVLHRESPRAVVQPLDLYARAAPDHPALAGRLRAIVTDELPALCGLAVAQAASETDLGLLLGDTTLSAAMNRLLTVIDIDPEVLPAAINLLPMRPDLVLSPLALTLTTQLVAHLRRLAAADPAMYEPALAMALNILSVRLGEVGRRAEGLSAIEEAVSVRRRLAAAHPDANEPDMATALNNLSVRLGEVGRREEGLAAIEEAVAVYRRLATVNPSAFEPALANALNNLSARLGEVGRRDEGLSAIKEAVCVYRRLATVNPAAHQPAVAMALTNYSNWLGEAGQSEQGVAAIQEAVNLRRQLAAANPAAFEPDLAASLTILSARLGEVERRQEGLVAIEGAVAIYRRLVEANPAAYESDLAASLSTFSAWLGEVGRRQEGLAAIEEAVAVYRRLAAAIPAAYELLLATALGKLSVQLGAVGRDEEGLAAIKEALDLYRGLGANSSSPHERALSSVLQGLAVDLGKAGRYQDALAAIYEAVSSYRQSSAANPAFPLDLAQLPEILTVQLKAPRRPEAGGQPQTPQRSRESS